MYPVNVYHGTVGGVKTDYRVIVMGVVRGGIYLFIFIYLLIIYSFIWSLVKDALKNFMFIATNNWMQ